MASTGSVPSILGRRGPIGPTGGSDEIDFKIYGQEMQFVEIELDPGESAVAEAGAMMFKDACIHMDTIFGDGSKAQTGFLRQARRGRQAHLDRRKPVHDAIHAHGRRQGARFVLLALSRHDHPVQAERDGRHADRAEGTPSCCAAKGVTIGIFFQRKIMTGLFGGEGFIMQKLEGDGYAFVHVGGCVVQRDLGPGETLHVDTGCVAAMTSSITFDVVRAGSVKSMIFGGEGVFLRDAHGDRARCGSRACRSRGSPGGSSPMPAGRRMAVRS